MIGDFKCPICEKPFYLPMPNSCSVCGWDLENDLSLGTFLENIPESMIEIYNQRVLVARRYWVKQTEKQKCDNATSEIDHSESKLVEDSKKPEFDLKVCGGKIIHNFMSLAKKTISIFQNDHASKMQTDQEIYEIDKKITPCENVCDMDTPVLDDKKIIGDNPTEIAKPMISESLLVSTLNQYEINNVQNQYMSIENHIDDEFPSSHFRDSDLSERPLEDLKEECLVENGKSKSLDNLIGESTAENEVSLENLTEEYSVESTPFIIENSIDNPPTSVMSEVNELAPGNFPALIVTNELVCDKKISEKENGLEREVYPKIKEIPDLERDPFETVGEFEERINSHPPLFAAEVELIKNEYEIMNSVFPLLIRWEQWVFKFKEAIGRSPFIYAKRDLAKALYDSGREKPVFAWLKAEGENVYVAKIALVSSIAEIEISFKYSNESRIDSDESENQVESAKETFFLSKYWKDFKRDAFEEIEEYEIRINCMPPLNAGNAMLIKESYDIESNVFPLDIEWDEWIKAMPSNIGSKPSVIVQRDIAKKIYALGAKHPIMAEIKADGERLSIAKIELVSSILNLEVVFNAKRSKWKNGGKKKNVENGKDDLEKMGDSLQIDYNQYLKSVSIPKLDRDPFETFEEFDQLINNYPPIYAGEATLIKRMYDIEAGIFPLQVRWEQWTEQIDSGKGKSLFIKADRDLAKALYNADKSHPILIRLKSYGEQISISDAILISSISNVEIEFEKDWVEPNTGMIFIPIPFGTFMMGDSFGDGKIDEKPLHEVQLDGFYLGKYPVTQGQWNKVMGNNPSHFKKGDHYPVNRVSWDCARTFIERLKKMNADQYEFCLPTETQWEYAARSGGKKERYPGGNELMPLAWYSSNSRRIAHKVGGKRPNGLGLYDMSGNVGEWCEDIYDSGAYAQHANKNPICNIVGSIHVIRGGSWRNPREEVRCAYRDKAVQSKRYNHVGFRLAIINLHGY